MFKIWCLSTCHSWNLWFNKGQHTEYWQDKVLCKNQCISFTHKCVLVITKYVHTLLRKSLKIINWSWGLGHLRHSLHNKLVCYPLHILYFLPSAEKMHFLMKWNITYCDLITDNSKRKYTKMTVIKNDWWYNTSIFSIQESGNRNGQQLSNL